jgi:WD40 repeat protein
VVFSPDGKTLAAGLGSGNIELWDVATGKSTAVLKGHTNAILSLAYSPDGKTLASGSDGSIKLWDVATGKNTATFQGDKTSLWSLAYSPDGKTLASVGLEGIIRLWNVTGGK